MILFTALILNLSMWIIIYRRVEPSSDFVPLHYNIYFGINYVGEWYRVFVIPFLGIFIGCVNIIIARLLHRKNKVASYILATSIMLVQAILLYSVHLLTSFII